MIEFLDMASSAVWKLLLLLLEIGGCVVVVMLIIAIVLAIWESIKS